MTMVISQCLACRHFNPSERRKHSCQAFDEIPNAIFLNDQDHRSEYAGDRGIRFEPFSGRHSPFEEPGA